MDSSRLARFRRGFLDYLPLALLIASYGVVFGALAVRSGLSVAESCLMSLTVFAGASQFMALPLIREGSAAWTMVLLALMVNLRHLLYGLAIGRMFPRAGLLRLLVISFGIVDENYAFVTVGPGRERVTPAYFLGTGVGTYVFWNLSTFLGALLGIGLGSIDVSGLDFTASAVFVSLVGSSLRGRRDWLVAAGAAALAWVVKAAAGGSWHMLAAGILVPLASASLAGPRRPQR